MAEICVLFMKWCIVGFVLKAAFGIPELLSRLNEHYRDSVGFIGIYHKDSMGIQFMGFTHSQYTLKIHLGFWIHLEVTPKIHRRRFILKSLGIFHSLRKFIWDSQDLL